LDGQYELHAHLCETYLPNSLTSLTIPHQTGLFSSIVASFLIETYKILLPDDGSQTVSLLSQLVTLSNGTAIVPTQPQAIVQQGATPSLAAIRVNILMFLSLFFSVTSALVSTLIQQWAREYLQYSQPNATRHKRRRTRTYLFNGLSQFQMRRLTYTVPILLHIAVFCFFFSLSDWLHTINALVGATARSCFIALLALYLALSILPLIVRNAPYQTPLTTPIRGCISLVHFSYVVLLQLVRRSSRADKTRKISAVFRSIHLDRSLVLKKEIKKRAPELDRSAMHWLLQKLDEVDMDTFLSCLPGFILSPLTDTKLVVEGLGEDKVLKRIATHLEICVVSLELSQDACMSRASAYIKSLRLFSSQIARGPTDVQPGFERYSLTAIIERLTSLCRVPNSSIALRALCVRGLVIREFLGPFDRPDAESDAQELPTKKFPDYLKPIYRSIRAWTTTDTAQSPHLTSISQTTSYNLPNDREMWTAILYDGPLINLTVLANGVLSCSNDEGVNLDIAWKTFEPLLKSHGLAQVRVSDQVRTRFSHVVNKARARVSSFERGGAQIAPLLDVLNIAVSGLRLIEVLVCAPKLPPRQIRSIFGREQLRNNELLEAFATHLPLYVARRGPEISKNFMERLILEDKLWEQLQVSLSDCLHQQVPFQDMLRTVIAVFDVLDVTFVILKDSSNINWQSPVFDLLFRYLMEFERTMMIDPDTHVKKIASFRVVFASIQFCHAVLAQFSMQCGLGEPFDVQSLNALKTLVWVLGLGSQEDREYLTAMNTEATPDLIPRVKAILHIVIHDGPLSNFCKLARLTLDLMLTKVSDPTFDNIKKSLTMLMRMLDSPHLPFDNASGEMWARFDDLRDEVRSLPVAGAVVPESSAQNAETPKSLSEMIEEMEHVRPSVAMCVEGPERDDMIQISLPASGVVGQDTQQPGDTPISSSSRQPAEASPAETGNTVNSSPNFFPLTPGAITIPVHMGRSPPSTWAPQAHSDPDANSGAHQLSTFPIPATQPGPNTEMSYLYWHDSRVHHPARFAPPYIHGMRPIRRASSLDHGRLLAYARMQSTIGTPYHMYQQSPVPLGATSLYPSPDSEYGACTYLFYALIPTDKLTAI